MKYAFIMNSATLNPDSYAVLYENEGNQYYFAAAHGMKMTRELVKKLADDGYELINLCGDYNEEKTEEIKKASGGKTRVCYAKYTEEQQAKFNALTDSNKYGIIVLGFDPVKDLVRLELESDEYNTYIAIIGREEMAMEVAKKMVSEGIHFIELCSYYDLEKAEKVIEAIDHKIPIGYCGD